MDNVLSGAGQPVIINHDRGSKNGHCDESLILSGQFQDAGRHSEQAMRSLGLHTCDTVERFGLKTLDELCDIRREVADAKCHISEKILEDGAKTRDLLRDQENTRLRDEVQFLRNQILANPVA